MPTASARSLRRGFCSPADPERVAAFRRRHHTLAAFPCDVLIALHPAMGKGKTCATFAEAARDGLTRRLAEEREAPLSAEVQT